jgi:hypothetical protein
VSCEDRDGCVQWAAEADEVFKSVPVDFGEGADFCDFGLVSEFEDALFPPGLY